MHANNILIIIIVGEICNSYSFKIRISECISLASRNCIHLK